MNKTRKPRCSRTIDGKIQKAQDVVLRTKARYEKALSELERLIALRKERQQRELMDALENSERSFEDVMRFLKG